jgi:hypothetical protein
MSHEANIYCKDCKIESEDCFKWDTIDDLLKLYVKILRTHCDGLKKSPYSIHIECYESISSFIWDHIEHEIIIKGEYKDDPEIKL